MAIARAGYLTSAKQAAAAQLAQGGAGRVVGREQHDQLLGVGSRELQQLAVEKEAADGGMAPRLRTGPGQAPAAHAAGERPASAVRSAMSCSDRCDGAPSDRWRARLIGDLVPVGEDAACPLVGEDEAGQVRRRESSSPAGRASRSNPLVWASTSPSRLVT